MIWPHSPRARTVVLTLGGFIITLQVALLLAALGHEREDIVLQHYAQGCRATLKQLQQEQTPEDSGNCSTRSWYLEQLRMIPTLTTQIEAAGGSIAEQAECAFGVRHQARISARARMPSTLQVALLRVRDFYVYGHFDGPEFDQLIGADPARSDYERILTHATTTNTQVNTQCQLTSDVVPADVQAE